jgi:hypothetical protein
VRNGIEHRAIERELLVGARQGIADHELQLGAEQADAGRAGVLDMRQVDDKAGIEHQLDRLAVLGLAGHVAQRAVLRLSPGPQAHALGISGFDFVRRPEIDRSRRAVDDHRIVRVGDADRVGDFADRRNAERAGDDRDMGVRRAFLEHEAAQPLAVVIEQRRRPHVARDQDCVVGQLLA